MTLRVKWGGFVDCCSPHSGHADKDAVPADAGCTFRQRGMCKAVSVCWEYAEQPLSVICSVANSAILRID